MPQGQFVAGWFTPVGSQLPDKPEFPGFPGGTPEHPIVLPPLPPGMGEKPPEPPPGRPEHPIFLPDTPEHPIQLPPGFVWPPFNPGDALSGKALLLCWVPGVGTKWVVIEVPDWSNLPPLPQPPFPQPQQR